MSFQSMPRPANRLLLVVGVLIAWVLWGFANVFRLGAVPGLDGREAFWYGFPDAILWALLTPWVVLFALRFPIRRDHRLADLGIHLLAAVFFALLHSAADAGVASLRAILGGHETAWWTVFVKLVRYGLQMNMLMYALVAGLVLYIRYERRLANTQAQLVEARLANLERQLRPHFLFNALNTVSGLIGGDPETGRRVVRRLGDLLRAGLEGGPGHRIPLRQELELARAYLEIERIRFEDRLRESIEIEPSGDDEQREATLAFPVPALILQPLVENAVTHAIAPREDGGSLRISASLRETPSRRLILGVEDDGPGIGGDASESGFGVGLRATRDRLQTLYGASDEPYLVVESADPATGLGTRVRLSLPWQS